MTFAHIFNGSILSSFSSLAGSSLSLIKLIGKLVLIPDDWLVNKLVFWSCSGGKIKIELASDEFSDYGMILTSSSSFIITESCFTGYSFFFAYSISSRVFKLYWYFSLKIYFYACFLNYISFWLRTFTKLKCTIKLVNLLTIYLKKLQVFSSGVATAVGGLND